MRRRARVFRMLLLFGLSFFQEGLSNEGYDNDINFQFLFSTISQIIQHTTNSNIFKTLIDFCNLTTSCQCLRFTTSFDFKFFFWMWTPHRVARAVLSGHQFAFARCFWGLKKKAMALQGDTSTRALVCDTVSNQVGGQQQM